ncbi:hypothetical protein CVS40_8778 [Lucilia cuprina]|nr:hypothetical protein CVS40_8778 [Lucilia cuprina]
MSEAKTPKKQKKRVQFNTSPLGPTVPSSTHKMPLKPAIQQQKYKASDASEYFHLRDFDGSSYAGSVAGSSTSNSTSSSIKHQEQQESTNQECINKQEILKYTTNNVKDHNNKFYCSSNFNKNLSVFNQKSLNMNLKQKTIKNVKINLKKLRFNNDISLTNFKSNFSKEQLHLPHTQQNTALIISNTKNNDNSSTYKRTETCQLKCNPIATITKQSDDDMIFKKPLPVTKKVFKSSPKPLKIHKVVSLRRHQQQHPYHMKPREVIKRETPELENNLLKVCIKQENVDDNRASEMHLEPENVNDNKTQLSTTDEDVEMDDLSKISKLLTEEINSLTCDATEKSKELKETSDLLISQELSKESLDKEKESVVTPKDLELKEILVEENITKSNKQLVNESNTNLSEDNETFDEVNPNILEEKEIVEQQNNTEIVTETIEKDDSLNLEEKDKNTLNSKVEQKEDEVKDTAEEQPKETEKVTEENLQPTNMEAEENPIRETITKDGDTEDTTVAQEPEILNEEQQSTDIESTETLEEEERTETAKLVTNFCAEYLAGLQNEPLPQTLSETVEEKETGHCDSKNDNDFEFENNCTTPISMCHIDIDVMTENTSELPASMPLTQLDAEACEAAKLLEDFNNKTEDIVDSALNKKALDNNESIENSVYQDDDKDSNEDRQPLKRLREKDEDHEEESLIEIKKSKCKETDEECLNPSKENITTSRKEEESSEHMEEETKIEVKETEIISKDTKEPNITNSNNINELKLTSSKTPKKQKNNSIQTELSKEKKLKRTNKSTKPQEKCPNYSKSENIKEDDTEEKSNNENSQNDNQETNTEPLSEEHSSKEEEMRTQEVEASLNENQHMTLELGNWNKEDMENETKTNDSDSQGVSAIFSFPKIPIISISICTTPNNKTYFKISNRENEKQSKEGNNKSKKSKSIQQDLEAETKNEEKELSTSLETQEIVKNLEESDDNAENINEDEEEDVEEKDDEEEEEDDEEEEEEEADNMEIEKFNHDSNSACSLPLKKRPTQAEPNEETEDTQLTLPTTYEQPQEIAAEVVIEDTDKDKETLIEVNQPEIKEHLEQDLQQEVNKNVENENHSSEASFSLTASDYDDNKPSTSANSLRKLTDPSSPFKRRVHMPIRPIGQPPIQIVAPQLKDNPLPCPTPENRPMDPQQLPTVARMQTQTTQSLPESYPATPMLSVANVEKLMDLNRFIEDLLASPDVMTIIDNANACGYYAEGQAYEMERIAILEHYNIANAKGNTSVTKPLYWKKSAGDTISIFNDNDNEWIALPPSTAKQLLKLSFVLSILQQQYKVSDVRQRINIALTFLIQTSYTSKFKKNSKAANSLQQRMQLYSRSISEATNSGHNISQPLPSASYFRIATNNEALNTSFNITHNMDAVQDFASTNYSSNATQNEMSLNQEPVVNANQSWNNLMQFSTVANTGQVIEQNNNNTNSPQRMAEVEQQQQQAQDKRNSTWEELNNDQLYINPPCATSPQNEVIVNTNGVQLHEMPQNFQDQQNIFISITDESVNDNGALHKYNTRQQHQQQQQQHLRAIGDEEPSSSSTQQFYAKRPCLTNNNAAANLMQNNFSRNNVINTFGNQEINLQNPYRLQQNQQQLQQQPTPLTLTNQHLNVTTSPNSNFSAQRNISPKSLGHNLPINIYNNNRNTNTPLAPQQQQQRMNTRYSNSFNAATTATTNQQQTVNKNPESNYKEILQPYITYLIKDHEKTSKHLLQVFEEVSNSHGNTTEQNNSNNSFNQPQSQFNSLLPPLIRNPQQNHMPGLHQLPSSSGSVLPSLVRNPHQTTMPHRDSGALQVVQSFLEQSQTEYDNAQQAKTTSVSASLSPTLPGFAKEYVNFVGSRDEIVQKQKLPQHLPPQQLQENHTQQQELLQQDPQRLNSVKRKCQERNDKLAEDLKRKMMEFSLLKHNVQAKLMEKQQDEVKKDTSTNANIKRRGRPKKNLITTEPSSSASSAGSLCNSDSSCEASSPTTSKQKKAKQTSARVTRRQQNNNDLNNTNTNTSPNSTTTTIDHAYFRQRTAAREAVKRINATVNNNYI